MSLRKLNRICWILVLIALPRLACAEDNNVVFTEQRKGDVVTLFARLTNLSEATVTIKATLVNMTSSVSLPLTVDVTGTGETALTKLTRIDPSRPGTFNWEGHWKYGHRVQKAPAAYVYTLPYKNGPLRVLQGPLGKFSHYPGSQDEQAIDFEMPIGTTIYAARPGTVVGMRTDCTLGAADPKLIPDYNYVIIKHDDGTYAEYLHLRKDGVIVHIGEKVALGQAIAYSGNTGYTTQPHLHFAVFYTLDGYLRRTIPVSFKSADGQTVHPETGGIY